MLSQCSILHRRKRLFLCPNFLLDIFWTATADIALAFDGLLPVSYCPIQDYNVLHLLQGITSNSNLHVLLTVSETVTLRSSVVHSQSLINYQTLRGDWQALNGDSPPKLPMRTVPNRNIRQWKLRQNAGSCAQSGWYILRLAICIWFEVHCNFAWFSYKTRRELQY